MDSGGGAWPKDLNIKQVVESYLGLPNLTLHGLLGLDTEAESQLREYLAQAYGSDPARANTFAREDVELAEPVGSLKHALRESPRASDAATHVPWAQDEDIHRRLYEILKEQGTPGKGAPGGLSKTTNGAVQQQSGTAVGGAGDKIS